MSELRTDAEIAAALSSGDPQCVVGLNGRGLVQIQLPDGCNYIVLSPSQAEELSDILRKHALRSRQEGNRR